MTSLNPKRAPPSDTDVELQMMDLIPAQATPDGPPTSLQSSVPQPAVPDPAPVPARVPRVKGQVKPFVLTKREPVLLDHKKRVKVTFCDWLIFVIYVLALYGFLVLSIYLLLKASKDDARTTGICYFAIFMFFAIALVVGVLVYQCKIRGTEVKRPDQETEHKGSS